MAEKSEGVVPGMQDNMKIFRQRMPACILAALIFVGGGSRKRHFRPGGWMGRGRTIGHIGGLFFLYGKQKQNLSGYEISYSTSRKFTKKTTRSADRAGGKKQRMK